MISKFQKTMLDLLSRKPKDQDSKEFMQSEADKIKTIVEAATNSTMSSIADGAEGIAENGELIESMSGREALRHFADTVRRAGFACKVEVINESEIMITGKIGKNFKAEKEKAAAAAAADGFPASHYPASRLKH